MALARLQAESATTINHLTYKDTLSRRQQQLSVVATELNLYSYQYMQTEELQALLELWQSPAQEFQ